MILASTACEVVASRAIAKGFASKNVPELEKPVRALMLSCSLSNERVRRVYSALTGDDLAAALGPAWKGFTDLVQLRNRTAHAGKRIAAAEARQGLDAAAAVVAQVERHNGLQGDQVAAHRTIESTDGASGS